MKIELERMVVKTLIDIYMETDGHIFLIKKYYICDIPGILKFR